MENGLFLFYITKSGPLKCIKLMGQFITMSDPSRLYYNNYDSTNQEQTSAEEQTLKRSDLVDYSGKQ